MKCNNYGVDWNWLLISTIVSLLFGILIGYIIWGGALK